MREDLLKAIAKGKGVTSAIILTHNIDFMFFQSVALPAFRRCGHPSITIFADAACALATHSGQREYLSGLGTKYRVVPVAMPQSHFRFHPKAILLSGPGGGDLFVGSGNLTFGGWRGNAEVWARFSSANDGSGPFRAFRDYMLGVLEYVSVHSPVEREVHSAFNENTWDWLAEDASSHPLILGHPGSPEGLLRQMLELAGTGYSKVHVCAPYFDHEAKALAQLIEDTSPAEVQILCQPSGTTLTRDAWNLVADKAHLQEVNFRPKPMRGMRRPPLMHSKFYAFEGPEEVVVFLGSANCSQAGLTLGGSVGNAELMAVQRMSPAEFHEKFLGEIELLDEEPELHETALPIDKEEQESRGGLQILAARYEHGSLEIGYRPTYAKNVSCLLGGHPVPVSETGPGTLKVPCRLSIGAPYHLILKAEVDGAVVESKPGWIDFEGELRLASQKGNLGDGISARLQSGASLPEGLIKALQLISEHLDQAPKLAMLDSESGQRDSASGDLAIFTEGDIFTEGYKHPRLGGLLADASTGASGGLYLSQLLARWFGEHLHREDAPSAMTDADQEHEQPDEQKEGDEVVDKPEASLTQRQHSTELELSDRDKRRIEGYTLRIGATMSSDDFLAHRLPESLAIDIQVAAIVLVGCLNEDCISQDTFFQVTQQIWSSLFLSCPEEPIEGASTGGWLEYRASISEGSTSFIAAMRSPQLSAALLGWTIATPVAQDTPEAARFSLASALAIARLPDLWRGDEDWGLQVAERLEALLRISKKAVGPAEMALYQEKWQQLQRQGDALRRLEEALGNRKPSELKDCIPKASLERGELIWQGRKAGYSVVLDPSARRGGKVRAKELRTDKEREYYSDHTIPVAALLEPGVLPHSETLGNEPRAVLKELTESLRTGYSGHTDD